MSGEIVSGLVGGLFGTLVGKVLGRFRFWKVFVVTLVTLYVGALLMGIVLVGFEKNEADIFRIVCPVSLAHLHKLIGEHDVFRIPWSQRCQESQGRSARHLT
ncbi:hypothetical protein [Burkholderia sp. Bp8998]|uniref:hypothetical protein n=1 Tax=Burkholderia sp. Bp8998 TaxID=2184557 RepID=UPI000F5900EF|nr:hypothetical protein [Burkholderia sp. Bp8998]